MREVLGRQASKKEILIGTLVILGITSLAMWYNGRTIKSVLSLPTLPRESLPKSQILPILNSVNTQELGFAFLPLNLQEERYPYVVVGEVAGLERAEEGTIIVVSLGNSMFFMGKIRDEGVIITQKNQNRFKSYYVAGKDLKTLKKVLSLESKVILKPAFEKNKLEERSSQGIPKIDEILVL